MVDCIDVNKIYEDFNLEFGENNEYRLNVKLTSEGILIDVFDLSKGQENAEVVASEYDLWHEMETVNECEKEDIDEGF